MLDLAAKTGEAVNSAAITDARRNGGTPAAAQIIRQGDRIVVWHQNGLVTSRPVEAPR